ncbi:hypothetical protein AA102526_0597 [Asaia lannensis NBRC 102526]|nr:hypothetical protein AA102526_0597 [Asaia lannensis NBRC 102526]
MLSPELSNEVRDWESELAAALLLLPGDVVFVSDPDTAGVLFATPLVVAMSALWARAGRVRAMTEQDRNRLVDHRDRGDIITIQQAGCGTNRLRSYFV